MHLLFVYGTLLPGLCRSPAMAGANWAGAAYLQGELFDLGAYPGLLPGNDQVHGQVAWVDDELLERLDIIEEFIPQHPEQSEYVRERMTVRLANGQTESAWVYVFNRSVAHATRITHGDYRRYLDEVGFIPTLEKNPSAYLE